MDLDVLPINFLLFIVAYLSAIIVGHLIVNVVLSRFPIKATNGVEDLKNAGMAIGILERVITLTFVLMGEYSAIAIIFAAKSIARFEELKERQFAEYYLIGTFTSILVAIFVGLLTVHLLE